MPDEKTYTCPSTLKSKSGVGILESKTPLISSLQVRVELNQGNLETVMYLSPKEGDLIIATNSEKDNIIFDINNQGELIVVSPSNLKWDVNSDGELILTILSNGT